MRYFVGLDVSLEQTAVCVMDSEARILHEAMVPTEPEELIVYVQSVGVEYDRIGLEAGALTPWLYHAMAAAGLPVVCIETRHAKAVMKAQQAKTDRNDARAIAQMMRTGWFRPVHIKSTESQKIRVLLNNRKVLSAKRIDIENQIRGTFKVFGHKLKGVSAGEFADKVRELTADDPELLSYVAPLLESRAVLLEQTRVLEKAIHKIAKGDEICRRFMTVPGVGPIIALMYKATIDNPHRFAQSRTVGTHLGLTPRKYASGEVDYDGRITKCGDTMMRTHLYEAAQVLLTRSARWSSLRSWGMQVAKRSSMKNACVAVARKLAVILHRMWIDGTDFAFKIEAAGA